MGACLAVVTTLAACGGGDQAGSDAGDGDVAAFCERLVALDQAPPPEQGGNRADEFTELVELAPDAIRAEVTALRDYQRDVYVEGDPGTDSIDRMPAEVQAAGERVDAFATSECEGWEPLEGP